MSGICVVGPITAGKNFQEIQETVVATFGDHALKQSVIYDFIRLFNAGKSLGRSVAIQFQENGQKSCFYHRHIHRHC